MLPPTRDRISAAPPRCSPNTRPNKDIVYPENNREMMPKPYLGPECSMETNYLHILRLSTKAWTIRNKYGYKYANIWIFSTISVSNGKCLTRLRALKLWKDIRDKLSHLASMEIHVSMMHFLPRWRWRTGQPSISTYKKRKKRQMSIKISAAPPLYGEVSDTCKKRTARWPATNNGSMAGNHNGTMANIRKLPWLAATRARRASMVVLLVTLPTNSNSNSWSCWSG